MNENRSHLMLALVAALALLLSACGGDDGAGSSPAPEESPAETEPSPEPTGTTDLEVWLALGDSLFVAPRTVPATPRVGEAAVRELIAGPSAAESDAGVSSSVPEPTELRALTIEDGTATVDLSSDFDAGGGSHEERTRLAQLVYTLTQFPTVDDVTLELDGERVETFGGHGIMIEEPMGRDDFEDLLPAILVERPAVGDRVSSPVRISGDASVFEATVSIAIYDSAGRELARTFTTATCGGPCRGDYEESVSFEVGRRQQGVVELFEESAEDGSAQNVVRIPVILIP